mmetsp:Transcript_17840/g.34749  ORF Transcript_17840/g.34749 Transcript_17840/m.34749 type:complete len:270 (+) Transcript_17840:624-1433(+)
MSAFREEGIAHLWTYLHRRLLHVQSLPRTMRLKPVPKHWKAIRRVTVRPATAFLSHLRWPREMQHRLLWQDSRLRIGHKHPPVDAVAGIRRRWSGMGRTGAKSRIETAKGQEIGNVTGKGARTGLETVKGLEPGRGRKTGTETGDGAGNEAATGGRQAVNPATAEAARAAALEVVGVPTAVPAPTNGSVFVLRARAAAVVAAVVDVPEGRRHRGQATSGCQLVVHHLPQLGRQVHRLRSRVGWKRIRRGGRSMRMTYEGLHGGGYGKSR